MTKDESPICLEEIKKVYNIYKEKYDLPEFTDLNRTFDIEDVDFESEFFLRKLRRIISERIAGYLRFVEAIINPSSAPMFFFKLIKKLDSSDKEEASLIHDTLGNLEIELIVLDLDYSEKNEAEFIKKCYDIFHNKIRKNLLVILEKLNNGSNKDKNNNNASYFG